MFLTPHGVRPHGGRMTNQSGKLNPEAPVDPVKRRWTAVDPATGNPTADTPTGAVAGAFRFLPVGA